MHTAIPVSDHVPMCCINMWICLKYRVDLWVDTCRHTSASPSGTYNADTHHFKIKGHKTVNDVVLLQANDQIHHAEERMHCIHCTDIAYACILLIITWLPIYSKHKPEYARKNSLNISIEYSHL